MSAERGPSRGGGTMTAASQVASSSISISRNEGPRFSSFDFGGAKKSGSLRVFSEFKVGSPQVSDRKVPYFTLNRTREFVPPQINKRITTRPFIPERPIGKDRKVDHARFTPNNFGDYRIDAPIVQRRTTDVSVRPVSETKRLVTSQGNFSANFAPFEVAKLQVLEKKAGAFDPKITEPFRLNGDAVSPLHSKNDVQIKTRYISEQPNTRSAALNTVRQKLHYEFLKPIVIPEKQAMKHNEIKPKPHVVESASTEKVIKNTPFYEKLEKRSAILSSRVYSEQKPIESKISPLVKDSVNNTSKRRTVTRVAQMPIAAPEYKTHQNTTTISEQEIPKAKLTTRAQHVSEHMLQPQVKTMIEVEEKEKTDFEQKQKIQIQTKTETQKKTQAVVEDETVRKMKNKHKEKIIFEYEVDGNARKARENLMTAIIGSAQGKKAQGHSIIVGEDITKRIHSSSQPRAVKSELLKQLNIENRSDGSFVETLRRIRKIGKAGKDQIREKVRAIIYSLPPVRLTQQLTTEAVNEENVRMVFHDAP